MHYLLAGLVFMSVVSGSQAPGLQGSSKDNRIIFRSDASEDRVGKTISEQHGELVVDLSLGLLTVEEDKPDSNAPKTSEKQKDTDPQVWLLRNDGTSLHQTGKPLMVGIGRQEGVAVFSLIYRFEHVPLEELSGAVVEVDGKLYTTKLKLDSK